MRQDKIKKYWDNNSTESMYDKYLLEIEINAISSYLRKKDTVIDIGCGEGEGTEIYYNKVKKIIAVDYSETRLDKLKSRNRNLKTLHMDMRCISKNTLNMKFDKAITQRSLINLTDFKEQIGVIKNIHSILKKNGRYIMLEGFVEGTSNVNKIRKDFGLPPIKIKWHNSFFNKSELLKHTKQYFELEYTKDFSVYFFMTRIFNAILTYPNMPVWNNAFNKLSKEIEIKYGNKLLKNYSRLELLVFKKK
jgi:ubiquinone/menaquinone biosynthesis C-methylase UbiE